MASAARLKGHSNFPYLLGRTAFDNSADRKAANFWPEKHSLLLYQGGKNSSLNGKKAIRGEAVAKQDRRRIVSAKTGHVQIAAKSFLSSVFHFLYRITFQSA